MTTRAILVVMCLLACAGSARAQRAAAPGQQTPSTATAPAAPVPMVNMPMAEDRNAGQTRELLRRILDQYPPTVRNVLRLDPSLLSRPDYLSTYPALAAFLAQHPEVAHNPTYFVGDVNGAFRADQPTDGRVEAIRGWRNFLEMVPVVAIVFIITSALAGLIRTLIEQRRWHRAARVQMDLQNKLIDRFSSTNELLGYIQSPVGRGLADLHGPASSAMAVVSSINGPLGRIVWSLQAGIVLTAAGVGLALVGARVTYEELGQPLTGLGILAVAVGIGFMVSAGASYLISHRLGLVAAPADFRRDTPAP